MSFSREIIMPYFSSAALAQVALSFGFHCIRFGPLQSLLEFPDGCDHVLFFFPFVFESVGFRCETLNFLTHFFETFSARSIGFLGEGLFLNL